MAAIRLARPSEVTRATTTRYAPVNPGPNPTPAMAVPSRKAHDVPVAIAANVTAAPARSARQPASIAVCAASLRSATVTTAAVPASRRIATPPHSRFEEPTSCAVSEGPSDR